MTKKAFDVKKAIETAWNDLWASNLASRANGGDWNGSSYYLTATDLERRVRDYAWDEAQGRPWGTTNGGYGYGIRIYTGRGSLLQIVRDWLHRQYVAGKLDRHNFGRGHVSGMRYRPVGEPIGERAVKTMAAKEARKSRPRLYHHAKSYGAKLTCQNRARVGWSRPRTAAWTTTDWSKVTCPRCLKLKDETVALPAEVEE